MPLPFRTHSNIATTKLILLASILALPTTSSLQAQTDPTIGPPAPWVQKIEYRSSPKDFHLSTTQAGSHYLLLDEQIDIETETRYIHRAIRIDNVKGAESQGRQTFDYEPTYQELVFHHLDVVRDGIRHNQIENKPIKTLQRETDLNLHLYDGTITALVIIEDLRPGDIIDYSYSLIGANPVLEGHFLAKFSFNYSLPVDHIRCLIRSPQDSMYQIFEEGEPPSSTKSLDSNGFHIEKWEVRESAPLLWEDGTPSWHNPYATVRISDFNSWKEVVDWALPLYKNATKDQSEICSDPVLPSVYLDSSANLEDRITAAIEFVQDEVRYFGIETGPNSLQPHGARLALKQRFGDCKDKASLLVTLLRGLGVDAYPVLVNSNQIRDSTKGPPTPYLFNHVVVLIDRESDTPILVDATYSYQRGIFPNRYQPNFGWGLPIREEADRLIELPHSLSDSYSLDIEESLVLEKINGSMSLEIVNLYKGGYADSQRNFFQSQSPDELKKSYQEYYGNYYDALKINSAPKIVDDVLNNRIQSIETYEIGEPWAYDSSTRILTLDSPVMKSALSFPSTKIRTMPLKIAFPFEIDKKVICKLPRKWDLQDSDDHVDNPYFSLSRRIRSEGPTVEITYSYASKTDEVPANDFDNYLNNANQAWNLLSYDIKDDISIPQQFETVRNGFPKVELILSWILATIAACFSYRSLEDRFSQTSLNPALVITRAKLIRLTLALAVLGSFVFLAHELIRIFTNNGEAYASLGSIERLVLAISLYEHLFFISWLIMAGLRVSSPHQPLLLIRRLANWNAIFLMIWLVVRSGIQSTAFGYQHTLFFELIMAIAISIAFRFLVRK